VRRRLPDQTPVAEEPEVVVLPKLRHLPLVLGSHVAQHLGWMCRVGCVLCLCMYVCVCVVGGGVARTVVAVVGQAASRITAQKRRGRPMSCDGARARPPHRGLQWVSEGRKLCGIVQLRILQTR
jgi:hypothetical protein